MRRAQQALLLGAPEREAQGAARLEAELGDLDRGLEIGGRARAVVVDPRAAGHGVQVRADDDGLRRVAAALVVGDDVLGRPGLGDRLGEEVDGDVTGARLVGELLADGVAGADDRDGHAGLAERALKRHAAVLGAGARRSLALVEDDRARRAR
ncbi:MAG TPA: hypothetical protein VF024_08880, partial [Solirubrobacteraceae bacterium]